LYISDSPKANIAKSPLTEEEQQQQQQLKGRDQKLKGNKSTALAVSAHQGS
jgi:hypothetical protein